MSLTIGQEIKWKWPYLDTYVVKTGKVIAVLGNAIRIEYEDQYGKRTTDIHRTQINEETKP